MNSITRLSWRVLGVCLVLASSGSCAKEVTKPANLSNELDWPAVTRQCRPWSRWWWLGSIVDEDNLTRLLTQYKQAGLGGVEICPIYGVKGLEESFIDFLSPKWMEMLAYTTAQAKQLDFGVDLTTGTGWPFGGPWVSPDIASARAILKRYELAEGEMLDSSLPEGKLQCLMAISDSGERIDLTNKVNQGRLEWTAPPGQWRLYAIAKKSPIQKVKRAAPGGEGSVLDPFSVKALDEYLARFDKAFADYNGDMPRCHFHDSYEYYGADWTPDFFSEFESRRGYDLRTQLPALFGDAPEDIVLRVKCDYRETLSDLHLAYIQRWTQWCHEHGSNSRNQAHGAPGNLLDIYAAADIPETEIFGEMIERKIPLMKFSSSAAHLTGRQLASAESFTWLGEHFQVPLSEVKQAADFLFSAGVNHILFHGIPYSPEDAPWPGWQFYAAVNFGPQGGLWYDLPQFNAYVTRCQSVLQSGRPDNDVLLYFTLHDFWHTSGDLLRQFTAHNMEERWVQSSSFFKAAMTLSKRGYAYDEVSDRLLAEARCEDGKVVLGGNEYKVIFVPECHLMPVATMRKLIQLADSGATILFQESLPEDVPGLGNLEKRRAEFQEMLSTIKLSKDAQSDIQKAAHGKGIFMTGNIETMLQDAGVARESCVDMGIWFVRRNHLQGNHYFLVNRSESPVNDWVTLGVSAKAAVIFDPLFENRIGVAALRPGANGSTQVYLQLQPGQSCILRTLTQKTVNGSQWRYFQKDGSPREIAGVWKVQFVQGGPELPASFETQNLASWTTLDDTEAKRFAGTARYTIEFDKPAVDAEDWLLDLGRVCESARVKLNGRYVGAVWCKPFQIFAGEFLQPGKNILEVEVTNLAANRIRDMDRRNVKWKYFYDINVVNKSYKPFDASSWPLRDSGLLGPVRLQPVKIARPANESVEKHDLPVSTEAVVDDKLASKVRIFDRHNWSDYSKKSDEWYRSTEGRRVAENILSWQTERGSWPKNMDTTAKPCPADAEKPQGTFDNSATTGELRFLARAFCATEDPRYKRAFTKGLDHILKAQYPSGGWPQFYPPDDNYHRYITFNDGTMVRLLWFVRDVATSEDYAFVDASRRRAAQSSFDRGIECILQCQIRVNDKLTVWCAQHDEVDYSPRPGRSYELVSLSGAESADILQLLMSIDNPRPEIIRAVKAGAEWFESAKLTGIRQKRLINRDRVIVEDPNAPPLWARFYEIGSNRPIFSGRDGVKKYNLSEIEFERREDYAWYGQWWQFVAGDYALWREKWLDRVAGSEVATYSRPK